MWHGSGPNPESIRNVLGRQKDIQYASRADSHVAKQKQLHRMRHVIPELAQHLPAPLRSTAAGKELAACGCSTKMHIAHLVAPRVHGEDHTNHLEFSPAAIQRRREAGYADTWRMIERASWLDAADSIEGMVVNR